MKKNSEDVVGVDHAKHGQGSVASYVQGRFVGGKFVVERTGVHRITREEVKRSVYGVARGTREILGGFAEVVGQFRRFERDLSRLDSAVRGRQSRGGRARSPEQANSSPRTTALASPPPVILITRRFHDHTFVLHFQDGSEATLRDAAAEDVPRARLFADTCAIILARTGWLPPLWMLDPWYTVPRILPR